MIKSLELRWIEKSDLLLPTVCFVSNPALCYGGIYYHPQKNEIEIDNKWFFLDRGLIIINAFFGGIDNSLAHEWRHHWQFFNCDQLDIIQFDSKVNYKKAIVKYFKSSKTELDALLFSHWCAKNDLSKYWISLLKP